jgi:hypothetical protein
VSLLHEPIGVGKRAEDRIDVRVVAYVIAEVRHRRRVEGREPEGVDAQIHEMVEAGGDSGQVAHPVPVRVGEGARIDLVDHAGAPPRGFLRRHGREASVTVGGAWTCTQTRKWSSRGIRPGVGS